MAKKKKPSTSPVHTTGPFVFEAQLASGPYGAVKKGKQITQKQAEDHRKVGRDVVVCGPILSANRALAGTIEKNANSNVKRCPPHANAGKHALPHFQPDPRPPEGHTFYETPKRKAV